MDTPSFKYTRHEEEWGWVIFIPLLMRHGPPPRGIKYAAHTDRYYVNGPDARRWHNDVKRDCIAAVEETTVLSHYKPGWRSTHAAYIKNNFIRWCLDERRKEINRLEHKSAAEHAAVESAHD